MIHEPQPGVVIVKLPSSQFGDIPVIDKPHNSITYGEIVAMHKQDKTDYGFMLGRVGHWRRWKEDCQLDEHTAAVEIKDILATSRKETNAA